MDLQSNPIFQQLDAAQLASFVKACNDVELPAGSVVMTQGQPGEYVCILVSGELSVRLSGGRLERELARLEPPAVVGEVAMLTGQPRSAGVVATTAVRLLEMPIETFRTRMADGDPGTLQVVANMARVLAFRLGALTEKLLELEAVVPEERVAELQQFGSNLFSDWSC